MTVAGQRKRACMILALSVGGILALTAATNRSATAGGPPTAPVVIHLHEVDTGSSAVDNPPKGTSAGDLLVFTAQLSSGGQPFGRYVGNCAYVTATDVFCSVDMNVFGQGRIEIAGEFSTQQADSVFPVTGGSGRFAQARGYLTNHQLTPSTSDQYLYLYLR
jgi:hypothetical protein